MPIFVFLQFSPRILPRRFCVCLFSQMICFHTSVCFKNNINIFLLLCGQSIYIAFGVFYVYNEHSLIRKE